MMKSMNLIPVFDLNVLESGPNKYIVNIVLVKNHLYKDNCMGIVVYLNANGRMHKMKC